MALVKCPECGESISSTVDTCIHCGALLRTCPNCQTAITGEMAFCPECGTRLAVLKETEVHPTREFQTANEDVPKESQPSEQVDLVPLGYYIEDWKESAPSSVIAKILYVFLTISFVLGLILVGLFVIALFIVFISGAMSSLTSIFPLLLLLSVLFLLPAEICGIISTMCEIISDIIIRTGISSWRRKKNIDLIDVLASSPDDKSYMLMTKKERKQHSVFLMHVIYVRDFKLHPVNGVLIYIFSFLDSMCVRMSALLPVILVFVSAISTDNVALTLIALIIMVILAVVILIISFVKNMILSYPIRRAVNDCPALKAQNIKK